MRAEYLEAMINANDTIKAANLEGWMVRGVAFGFDDSDEGIRRLNRKVTEMTGIAALLREAYENGKPVLMPYDILDKYQFLYGDQYNNEACEDREEALLDDLVILEKSCCEAFKEDYHEEFFKYAAYDNLTGQFYVRVPYLPDREKAIFVPVEFGDDITEEMITTPYIHRDYSDRYEKALSKIDNFSDDIVL